MKSQNNPPGGSDFKMNHFVEFAPWLNLGILTGRSTFWRILSNLILRHFQHLLKGLFINRQSPIFFIVHYTPFESPNATMAFFIIHRHPVTILFTAFTDVI